MSVIVLKKGPEAQQRHKVTCNGCKSELSYADEDLSGQAHAPMSAEC